MDHFLITRFNLRDSAWATTKSGTKVLTDEWLNYRFEIFEKFTLPSVINQSNKNFRWLIFFDRNTPFHYKKKALDIQNTFSFVNIYFIDGMQLFLEKIILAILSYKNSNSSFLITTRLDNDDVVHEDFIKSIQALFIPEPGHLIDLRRGYQLCIESKIFEIRNFYDEYTHFISLIEHYDNFVTVFSRNLEDWRTEQHVTVNSTSSLFIEIIHGENLANATQHYQPFVVNFKPWEFGIVSKHIRLHSKIVRILGNRSYYSNKIKSLLTSKYKTLFATLITKKE